MNNEKPIERTMLSAIQSIKEGKIEELYEELNSECYSTFIRLKEIAESKESISETLKFWNGELKHFNNTVSPYMDTVSGSYISHTLNRRPLFLDKFILNEINYINSVQNVMLQYNDDELQTEIKEVQQKIAWLHAIGVIDNITKSTGVSSSNGIARILRPIINGTTDSIRKALERIRSNENGKFEQYSEWINKECLRLKIIRVN